MRRGRYRSRHSGAFDAHGTLGGLPGEKTAQIRQKRLHREARRTRNLRSGFNARSLTTALDAGQCRVRRADFGRELLQRHPTLTPIFAERVIVLGPAVTIEQRLLAAREFAVDNAQDFGVWGKPFPMQPMLSELGVQTPFIRRRSHDCADQIDWHGTVRLDFDEAAPRIVARCADLDRTIRLGLDEIDVAHDARSVLVRAASSFAAAIDASASSVTQSIRRWRASLTTCGQYPAGIESRSFICLAFTSGRCIASRNGTTPPKASMTSENDFMDALIHQVLGPVNTARMNLAGTLRISMTDEKKRLAQAARLRDYRLTAGFKSASEAARTFGWTPSTYISHENGTRKIGDDDADKYASKLSLRGRRITGRDIMYGPTESVPEVAKTVTPRVRVMGYVGAGGDVDPDYEQVPPEGLREIELPFSVPDELIAFEVDGDSMLPKYEDRDVILVWRETRRPIESFYGKEAVVRTSDGHRYIKTILYGKNRSVVNLQSFNAKLIEGVRLEWIGEIYSVIRGDQVQKLSRTVNRAAERSARRT